MKRSNERILTTHVGSMVRPPEILEFMRLKESGQAYDAQALADLVRDTTTDVVRKQVECGVDIPSNGEYGKSSFSGYVSDRLTGYEPRPRNPNESAIEIGAGTERNLRNFTKSMKTPGAIPLKLTPWFAPAP